MPIRYIQVPSPITFIDPSTRKPLMAPNGEQEKPVSFEDVMLRLLQNPSWSESYHAIKAQDGVVKAMEASKETGVLAMAEEDWQRLKAATEFPKTLNYHPVLLHQLLPILSAIMEATTTNPMIKAVPETAS
jgi:hypothetical protein